MEISQGRATSRDGVSEVVVPNPIVEGKPSAYFPRILGEQPKCAHRELILARLGFAGDTVVREAAFAIGLIVNEVDHIIVGEVRDAVRARK